MRKVSFWGLLGNNVFAFFLGTMLALIGIAPEDLLTGKQKFYLAIIVVFLLIGLASVLYLYRLLSSLQELKTRDLPYLNAIPKLIRVLKSNRIYKINQDYSANIEYYHEIINNGTTVINDFCIPFYSDCNNPIKNSSETGLTIESIMINSKAISSNFYRTHLGSLK